MSHAPEPSSLASVIKAMPKVELHVHLEGSIRPETLLTLARRNRVDLPAASVEELREWYKFTDFASFVQVYVTASGAIKTPADIELVAREFASAQREHNVLHTESHYTAETIRQLSGIPIDEQVDALNRGIAAVPEVSVRWIFDTVRHWPAETGERIASWCQEYKSQNVCAFGLTGFELVDPRDGKPCPARVHAPAFRALRQAGVPITAHCGETKGPESIREVLESVHPNRIGHGVRAVEDPSLIRELRESQIHLEVSPSSNVCLGVFPSLDQHSLPRLLDEGVSVSIGTDDPPMFNTDLTTEYLRCVEAFGLTTDILYSLNLQAIQASFLPDAEKATLRERFQLLASQVLD